MTTYGYCRISTPQQSIDRQIRNIKKIHSDATIIQEVFTGTKNIERKEWQKLIKIVRKDDTIIFDSVSRMSRDAEDGFAAYEDLYNKGVNLVFLKEPHINTETFKTALEKSDLQMTGTAVDFILEGVTKYLMALAKEQIKLAFEQSAKEVEDLHQRTIEGIETARLNGKQIGQVKGAKLNVKKKEPTKELILKYCKEFGQGTLNDTETIKQIGIARNTYYKYKKELKEEILD